MPKFKTPKMFPTTDCGETETQAKALNEQWEVIALAGQVRWASNKDCAFIQLRQRMGHFNITIVGWKRPDYLLQNSNEVSAVLETLWFYNFTFCRIATFKDQYTVNLSQFCGH